MKAEGKGWHFRREKGMEENISDRQEVGGIKTPFRVKFNTSQVAQWWRTHLPMQEMQVRSLGQEDSPGGGNGNPLRYSCLGNPIDRAAWRATFTVSQSQTRLSDRACSFNTNTSAGVSYHQVSHDWMNSSKKYIKSKHIFLFEYSIKLVCKHPYFSTLFFKNLALYLSFLFLLENY